MKASIIYLTEKFIRFCEATDNSEINEINIVSRKREDIPHLIRNLLKEKKIQPEHLILGMPRTEVSVRFISLPTVNENEIRQMIEFDLNSLFPYKPEEMVYDYAVIRKSPEGYSRVMLVAVAREAVLQKFSLLKHAGLIPDEVALSTVSLCNQCKKLQRPADYVLLYCDDGFVDCLYIKEQKLEFSRGISFNPEKDSSTFLQELSQTFQALSTQGMSVDTVVVSGKNTEARKLVELIKGKFDCKIETDASIEVVKGLIHDGEGITINLLPEEYRIYKIREKRKRSLVYLGILLLINISLLANITFFKIKAKDEYLVALKAEIKKVEPRVLAIQKKQLKASTLQAQLNAGRLKLGLLSEIYRAAPGEMHLNYLEISGMRGQGTILVKGQAPDSESIWKFANNLKASAFIEKTDVTEKSQRENAAQPLVDFVIKANY